MVSDGVCVVIVVLNGSFQTYKGPWWSFKKSNELSDTISLTHTQGIFCIQVSSLQDLHSEFYNSYCTEVYLGLFCAICHDVVDLLGHSQLSDECRVR